MIDLNHGSGYALGPRTISDKVNEAIDAGIMARRAREPERTYLGASQLGDPCSRKLLYSYSKTPVDPARVITARTARIFATGHMLEDAALEAFGHDPSAQDSAFTRVAAQWLHDAGFSIKSKNSKGEQFGFAVLDGRIKGHIDGAIVGLPSDLIKDFPKLPGGWEHKGLNVKGWNKIKKNGLKIGHEIYFGQVQIYMAYMGLWWFLFSATNKNTSEMHHEIIEFDPPRAQALSDRGLEIIKAREAGAQLPRIASNPDFYLCKFCDWKDRCWREDA